MNAIDLPRYSPNVSSFHSKLLPVLLLLYFLTAAVLRGNAQSANLDQGANGSSTAPTSPVDWVNGNLNNNQAHFLEGYSVPYRAVLTNLVANKTYTLVIGLDITASGKHALDYITQFQRFEPHGIFLHAAETVDPLLNITGFPESYFTSTSTLPIPAPSSAGSPVAGQPTTSFNALPASERVMTGYNATLGSVVYASEGSLTGSNSETVINITFTALKETVVLAWGGHIASVFDWGKDASGRTNSASGINGSPYHMRLKNWIIDGNVVSIGNQDRSLKTNAVFIPPEGSISGPSSGCIETTALNYTSTVDDPTGLTYLWSIIGSNTANAKIVNNTLANIQVVPIGATFTAGSFNLQLIVTRNGLSDTSYLGSDVYPGQLITLSKVMVNAGADQSITNLDTAYLSASASGGVSPYTFSWSPVTGLSNPNIFNPQFIPTGTGTFQFVVTATDSAGCVGKDTVVITVTQHPAPPCIINGANPVCPGSSNVYMGPLPSQVGSYSWSITGDGSITGAITNDTVTVMAGNTCGSYTLQLITTTTDGKVKDTCSLVVNVKDTIAPVLSGTAPDAAINCAKDLPAAPVITATDNCIGNVQVQMSQQTIDSTCVNKFKLVRKWWAVDACGNTSDTLTQTITVNDNVKPVITANFPQDVKVQCVGDIPAPPAPTATDNCDALVTPVYDEMGSGTACDSTIVRTWIFADACGNSDSVKQTIHIKDSIAPVLSGTAPDASITCAKDIPTAPVITASDNCTANVVVQMKQYTTDSTCVNKFKLVRKWWAVDACGNSSDTLKQTITVNDNVKPVITANFTDVNIQCLKDIPPVPTPTATDNCDATVTPVYSQMGSGTSCDSTIVRTWIFADVCGNSDSVKQTIHIKNNVVPVLSGTATNLVVACAKDVPAPPTITASGSCSGATVYFSAVTTDSTCVNKFTVVRKWWAVDGCGNKSDTIKQTIIVKDSIAPIVATAQGIDKLISCSAPLVYDAPTFTDNCNGKVTVTTSDRKVGTVCPFKYIRRWTATDECGNSIYVEQAITVSCCASYCTYTQGFYGNKGGLGCTPGGGSLKALQMMTQVVDAQPGDSAIFGLKSTGKFFTLLLTDVTNSSIFNMLPGGGTPAALKGYATYSKSATWPNVPLSTASTTFGKINNVLLSQTMTLFFNMGITPTLSALTIDGDSLFTAKLTTCGSNTPVSQIDAYKLPVNVVAYLSSTGQATVQGLFMLANKYLGGQTVSGVSASDVTAAIDAINNGFNNCAVLVRWAKTVTAISNISSASYDNSGQVNYSKETAPLNLSVTVFPNPYTETIFFRYVAPETGKAQLELYNLQGRRVAVIYNGEVTKGSLQLIEYHVPEASRILFIYRLSVGQFTATGKIVPTR